MGGFASIPFDNWQLFDLLVARPSIVGLVGLWLLGYFKHQSAHLQKYSLSIVLSAITLTPIVSLVLPHISVPIFPHYQMFLMSGRWQPITILGDANLMLLVLGVYLAGVFYQMLKLLVDILAAKRLVQQSRELPSRELLNSQDKTGELPNLEASIRLRVSKECVTPLVFGVRTPTIILPESFLGQSDHVTEQIIGHELAHIRHRDGLLLIAARVCCSFLWHMPFIWKLLSRLVETIESVCDDEVLRTGQKPYSYATTLINTARQGSLKGIALSFSRKELLFRRVEAVLDRFRCRCLPSFRVKLGINSFAMFLVFGIALVDLTLFELPPRNTEGNSYPLILGQRPTSEVQDQATLPARNVFTLLQLHESRIASREPVSGGDDFPEVDGMFVEPYPGNATENPFANTTSYQIAEPFAARQEADYRPTKMVLPVYPGVALEKKIQGNVNVSYRIDQDGNPIALEIEDANPRGVFEDVVVRAVSQYRFRSLSESSPSISSVIKSRFVFKLSGLPGTTGMTSVYLSYPGQHL